MKYYLWSIIGQKTTVKILQLENRNFEIHLDIELFSPSLLALEK